MGQNYGTFQNADQTQYDNGTSGLSSTTVRDAIDELAGIGLGGLATDQPCDATVSVGDFVRVSGSSLIRAVASTVAGARWVGVCESKPTSTTCNIRMSGATKPIFVGLDVTKTYSLSKTVPGGIEETNSSTGISMFVGIPLNTTTLVLERKRGYRRA